MWPVDYVIERLEQHLTGSSLREVAGEIGISHGYLADIMKGARSPGPRVLDYLNMERAPAPPAMYRRKPVHKKQQVVR